MGRHARRRQTQIQRRLAGLEVGQPQIARAQHRLHRSAVEEFQLGQRRREYACQLAVGHLPEIRPEPCHCVVKHPRAAFQHLEQRSPSLDLALRSIRDIRQDRMRAGQEAIDRHQRAVLGLQRQREQDDGLDQYPCRVGEMRLPLATDDQRIGDQCRVVLDVRALGIELVQRIEAAEAIRTADLERIEDDDGLALLAARPRRDSGQLALRVDRNRGAVVHQQVRDQQRDAFAPARAGNGQDMPIVPAADAPVVAIAQDQA